LDTRLALRQEERLTLESLIDQFPDYARDIKLNLGNVLRQTELSPQQLWGTALACATASRNSELLTAIGTEAKQHLSPEAFDAARTAAAIMGMNNIYYRFLHLTDNGKYATIPARLRMQGIRSHGIDHVDFELWCTAVSAINNCPACVASHEKVVREKGISEEQVAAAVRIASVMHAAATVLDEQIAARQ
jgi:alkyl hydroperoxide reductase subunit D